MLRPTLIAGITCALASLLPAQWNPSGAAYGKTATTDIRVMTWNVRDTLCTTNPKVNSNNNWSAMVRIVASFQPDVLLLQECGDNDGNGTGGGVDSVTNLTTTANLFMHGGNDPFRSGNPPVTSYVQLYAPGYDLPFIFVSSNSDGFNRNVILSRYPFVDLNGDTRSTLSDLPTVTADLYAPGGNGGIRGFQIAEIDLPNGTYAGDLVVGNSHLKAGSSSADRTQRVTAARNIAYGIDYFYCGAGTGIPDPNARIADSPPATQILSANSLFVAGGDWNEDEATNGTVGPAQWISQAQAAQSSGGLDGPDRNRGDMALDNATDIFGASLSTTGFGSKFDYLSWQRSIGALRRSFIFNSATVTPSSAMPSPLVGYSGGASGASTVASDHRPVVIDLILPGTLSCNTAGVDLAFASPLGDGRLPRFSTCGSLMTGGTATALLASCPANAQVFALASVTASPTIVISSTLVPAAPVIVGPFFTNIFGTFSLPLVGGGGPVSLFAQFAVIDALAPGGFALSNALRLDFGP